MGGEVEGGRSRPAASRLALGCRLHRQERDATGFQEHAGSTIDQSSCGKGLKLQACQDVRGYVAESMGERGGSTHCGIISLDFPGKVEDYISTYPDGKSEDCKGCIPPLDHLGFYSKYDTLAQENRERVKINRNGQRL